MASIISSGIGSGLDVSGIVSQLVAAEGQPAEQRILRGEAAAQSKLSAYGSLKATLSEFRDQLDIMKDLNQFLARKASSANEDLFTVSADTTALPASYAVEVVQLASAQKLTSGAFADADTAIGTGTLQIDVGGNAFSLEITEDNNTLAGIRDAINAASDNSGVAATIVNADAGSYLILSGDKTGEASTITVTQADGDGGLAALEYDPPNGLNSLNETSAAQDALIRVDGFDVTSDNNSIAGAINGVTIDLVQSAAGTTETLTIANDTDEVRRTINEFVESYNQLITTFDSLSAYDAENQVGGPLLGDASLRSIRDQLRREMSVSIAEASATFGTLREIGIETELNGQMSVVEEDLTEVLNNDFTSVGQLFASNAGFAVRLFDVVDGFLSDEGILTTRTEGLTKTIETYTEQRDSLNERLAALETRLLRQFNAMDALVAQLSNTSSFLTQQLASLPTVGDSNG
ncbi:MAG: flagellar filament capping protein FliD [Gammaproteobacteria bacterium]|nr:flagellar filament capping protein FliD [Gammaproteobacteria bacterium]